MGQERQMTSYLRNLQLGVCCERAPPLDCSEKYCSGYSVLHFSPKPRFYTEDSQRFTELCPHNIFQKYGLLSNFCWTHTHTQDYILSPEVNALKCVSFQRVFITLRHPQCHISETQSQLHLCLSSRRGRPRYEE